MVRIFNIKTNHSIKIDIDTNVFLFPNDYDEENPHIKILIENFNFGIHSSTCNDCKALLNSFGSYSTDWYIEYLNKTKRLNLEKFSNKHKDNHCINTISDVFQGTELKLNIDTDTIESLQSKLQEEIEIENYEGCEIISKKIKALNS